jgi:hypothetical protein
MKSYNFARHVVPAFGFICMLGFAPLAMAQSAGAPTTTAPAAPASAPTSKMAPVPAKPAGAKLSSAEKFTTVASATSHCGDDTVVWASTSSKALHLSTSKYFGKSKHGAYVCEKQAVAAGYHVSKI